MPFRFYGIRQGLNEDLAMRVKLYKEACEKRGIDYIDIDALTFDYSAIPTLTENDFLYKIGRGGFQLESLMLNDKVITFYKTNPLIWFMRCTSELDIIHEKSKLPKPRTIHFTSSGNKLLEKYVEYLNGFPIVLKVSGGTRGQGVIKVESYDSLISTIDYLFTEGKEIILKEYIMSDYIGRLLVVGDKVVHSIKSHNQPNDFRSNSAPLIAEPYTFTAEVEQTAIKSVHQAGVELGGVDIIFDSQGNHYLLEMNFPCGIIAQTKAGFDVAGTMIDFLIRKRRLLTQRI